MKIAHINENNQLLGWYDKDIHEVIPTPNIEVTDEQWQEAIDNGHNKVNEDGTTELFDFRTAEEIAEQTLKEEIAFKKSNGEVYTLNNVDYQVPFMKDDAYGVLQVKSAFDLGITNTVIYFTNGTKMPIQASEFMDFAVWFANKRNSFFVGDK